MYHAIKNLRNRWKYCIVLAVVLAFINEWLLCTIFAWLKWHNLHSSSNSVRLLIVSDPQLLGERYTLHNIFGFVARFDADRYISRSFSRAYHHVKPDIIIFLGDLLDEGEIANDEEYLRYLKRFQSVFYNADFKNAIVIPGDNDIGGENDIPSPEMEKRFDLYFKSDHHISYKFLEFVKVNYMTQSRSFLSVPNHSPSGTFRVLLSHIPLTPSYGVYGRKVLQYLHPHLILSAHEHVFKHFVYQKESEFEVFDENTFHSSAVLWANLTGPEVHEIMNPTCSYRMGRDKMGYGSAVISSDGIMKYTVLWLPSRFHQLFSYLGLMMFIVVIVFFPASNQKLCFDIRSSSKWS